MTRLRKTMFEERTTEDIRDTYARARYHLDNQDFMGIGEAEFNYWLSNHDFIVKVGMLQKFIGMTKKLKAAIRGDGYPGNAGELISVNYVEQLINETVKDFIKSEQNSDPRKTT